MAGLLLAPLLMLTTLMVALNLSLSPMLVHTLQSDTGNFSIQKIGAPEALQYAVSKYNENSDDLYQDVVVQVKYSQSQKFHPMDGDRDRDPHSHQSNGLSSQGPVEEQKNLHPATDGDRDRDPRWNTGLSSQGPVEEQKEREDEHRSQNHKGFVHPLKPKFFADCPLNYPEEQKICLFEVYVEQLENQMSLTISRCKKIDNERTKPNKKKSFLSALKALI